MSVEFDEAVVAHIEGKVDEAWLETATPFFESRLIVQHEFVEVVKAAFRCGMLQGSQHTMLFLQQHLRENQ